MISRGQPPESIFECRKHIEVLQPLVRCFRSTFESPPRFLGGFLDCECSLQSFFKRFPHWILLSYPVDTPLMLVRSHPIEGFHLQCFRCSAPYHLLLVVPQITWHILSIELLVPLHKLLYCHHDLRHWALLLHLELVGWSSDFFTIGIFRLSTVVASIPFSVIVVHVDGLPIRIFFIVAYIRV